MEKCGKMGTDHVFSGLQFRFGDDKLGLSGLSPIFFQFFPIDNLTTALIKNQSCKKTHSGAMVLIF
jgi:hypothetical protein